ncbi:biopolymer transporter ExbD [Luteolibacter flavescens]|uniref:Biopolymer transporter ExbD n=1 Tax=Luteolibacter flavescens TaxID=1859460 RepID=A0ABT3FTR8_9BACT|nr:biopolymer transporter ExbD [Luteolibacter flavescens]MCW1886962.1 biopolymer transporter ExbD [Luteolibacter flavescens]
MKLESTLPERPGFLFVVPVFNLCGLLLVFLLLGGQFVNQSGVAVELPVSRFQMERQTDASVVTVTAGDPPGYWLEREPVTLEQLSERLDARRGSESGPSTTVLLRVDKGVPVETQRTVAEVALQKGLRVYLLGQPEAVADPKESP